MSSIFTFDNWESLLDPPAPPTLSTGDVPSVSVPFPSSGTSATSLSSSGVSSPSGEYHPFFAVGAALAGGGGRKVFSVIYSEAQASCCLGLIGSSKFCLKELVSGSSCGVQSHEVKKFSFEKGTFYLKENDSKAFIKPAFTVTDLDPKAVDVILTRTFTLKEWEASFEELKQGCVPEWLQDATGDSNHSIFAGQKPDGDENEDCVELELVSPKVSMGGLGIFGSVPTLSFEDELEIVEETDEASKVQATLNEFQRRFVSLKQKWAKTFTEIEASHIIVVRDLQQLQQAAGSLVAAVGRPNPALRQSQGSTLWGSIGDLSHSLAVQGHSVDSLKESVDLLEKQRESMQQTLAEVSDEQESSQRSVGERISMLERCATTFEQRFNKILPILLNVKSGGKSSSPDSTELSMYRNQVHELTARLDSIQSALWSGGVSHSPAPLPCTLEATLVDLQSQVKILQQRVVGGGVQIGAKVFQSFEDVETWVKAELPNQRYGLFVDAVSLLDFFTCIGHVDADKTFAAFHNQQKTGFASMYEARVAASVQNLFPMVFGKANSTGLDDSEYLPAIQDPDKWDNGVTGIKHQICRGMSDVEYQLESAIESVLSRHTEAKQLAKECLYKAKRFVSELCNFMTNDFQKWKFRGHGKKEAWKMTAVSVRRIFEEIHSERVVARDIYDYKDSNFSTAKFLWATWKAHAIMERYTKHQFYEHPAIAAVLARHLADNYVKPDDALANKLNALDKAHKSLVLRFDTMMARDKENRAKNGKGRGTPGGN